MSSFTISGQQVVATAAVEAALEYFRQGQIGIPSVAAVTAGAIVVQNLAASKYDPAAADIPALASTAAGGALGGWAVGADPINGAIAGAAGNYISTQLSS